MTVDNAPGISTGRMKSRRDALGINSTQSFRDIRSGAEAGAVCPPCGNKVPAVGSDAKHIVFGICLAHPNAEPWIVTEDNRTFFGRVYRRKPEPTKPVGKVLYEASPAIQETSRHVWTFSDMERDTPPPIQAWCWVCGFKRIYPQRRTYRTDYRCKLHPNTEAIIHDPNSGATWLGNGWDNGKQRGTPQYAPYPDYRRAWQPG